MKKTHKKTALKQHCLPRQTFFDTVIFYIFNIQPSYSKIPNDGISLASSKYRHTVLSGPSPPNQLLHSLGAGDARIPPPRHAHETSTVHEALSQSWKVLA